MRAGSAMVGETLGHYRVIERIGEGGMGVVYKAQDTRLRRIVALKVLRPGVSDNPDRLVRFQREARLLAALNHPNIAAIHGLEEHGGTSCLVLEFVEGQTLAERIARGPLLTAEVIGIAKQIARAVAEAHESGIIHRDLKPSNVKLKPDGTAKVLDFGLAKALLVEHGPEDSTASELKTREDLILGTPSYMSPEQARGGRVDSSTDIWAFGCVLFEMLTGERAFQGTTSADARAAVLRDEPLWELLPADASPSLHALVRGCLEREPKDRLRHIGDAHLLLDSAQQERGAALTGTAHRVHPRSRWIASFSAIGLVMLGAIGGFVIRRFPAPSESPSVLRLPMAPPALLRPSLGFGPSVTVSPDGRTLAYVLKSGTSSSLYVKRSYQLEAQPMGGTGGARNPFFSPRGEWIAFYDEDDRKLKKLSVGGGEPVTIADVDFQGGASWARDDRIVFASTYGLMRVSAAGGSPEPLTKAPAGQQWWPTLLPAGDAVLFTSLPTRGTFDAADVLAMPLPSGTPKTVLKSAYYAHYSPTGHVIFVQGNSVLAAPFDTKTLEVTGPAMTVLSDVWISSWIGYAEFAFSDTGTLVYVSGGPHPTKRTLVSVDRRGRETPLMEDPRAYRVPRVSPDVQQVAVTLVDQQVDIWICDLARKTLNRLTDSPSWDAFPLWQPGGRWIAFSSMRDGLASIYRQDLRSGAVEKLLGTEYPVYPDSWSPDGRRLAYAEENARTGLDIWIYSLDSRTTQPFLQSQFNELNAEFSRDGRFIAYESGEAGEQAEVYVRPYPEINPRKKISIGGGTSPRWRKDGRELFYRVGGKVMSVDITTTPDLDAGTPRELFGGPYGGYDVLPDGQSFIMVKEMAAGDPPTTINLIVNWFHELKRAATPGVKP